MRSQKTNIGYILKFFKFQGLGTLKLQNRNEYFVKYEDNSESVRIAMYTFQEGFYSNKHKFINLKFRVIKECTLHA